MKIFIPDSWVKLFEAHYFDCVEIGIGGIQLEKIADMPSAQNGYGVVPDGEETDWKNSWIVVGKEMATGDPIFIDCARSELPVYTAVHGMGTWEPEIIAPSAESFFEILRSLSDISVGRDSPVALEKNSIKAEEKTRFFELVSECLGDRDPSFWMLLIGETEDD